MRFPCCSCILAPVITLLLTGCNYFHEINYSEWKKGEKDWRQSQPLAETKASPKEIADAKQPNETKNQPQQNPKPEPNKSVQATSTFSSEWE